MQHLCSAALDVHAIRRIQSATGATRAIGAAQRTLNLTSERWQLASLASWWARSRLTGALCGIESSVQLITR